MSSFFVLCSFDASTAVGSDTCGTLLAFTFNVVVLNNVFVCRLSVTFVHPTQAVRIFGNISTALGTLAMTSTENFTEIVPREPLRRGS